jgi:SnoaL-like domain
MTLKLEDIELIRQVTYRYFRSVDMGDFDAVEDCFTDDASVAFIGGSYRFEQQGRVQILDTLRTILNSGVAAMHTAHHPEITVLTDTTAEGIWYLTDWAINLEHKIVTHGACLVRNQYRKIGGEWKIRHYGYTRIYEQIDQLDALPRITAHALADACRARGAT